jgi:regulator of protease activity HflC (stomatin/prohibitin superfamily)
MEAGIFPELAVAAELATVVVSAIIFVVLAALLGYLGARDMGVALLGGGAAFAAGLCIVGELAGIKLGQMNLMPTPADSTFIYYLDPLGRALGEFVFSSGLNLFLFGDQLVNVGAAHTGLLAGMVLAGILIPSLLGQMIEGKSRRFITLMWLLVCGLCLTSYRLAGATGTLTIAWPAMILFWVGLYRISDYLLPLRDSNQHKQAFRSLVSFAMGTNYPVCVMQNGKLEERVKGNPFLQFFAGPGIVYTECDHAAYVTDGVKVKGVLEPGLGFTGMFDQKPRPLDLKPQLRAFTVEALTKDGIPVKVLTFAPFRIDPGGAAPTLGQPFPFRKSAVSEIVSAELVERKRKLDESGQRHEWDGQLVPLVVTRIVQDIISEYAVDDLCAQLEPDLDPRVEIAAEMRKRAKEALLPMGIELVGGGISNLVPDGAVVERRLDNWRTDWERKILAMMNENRADYVCMIEDARAAAEAETIEWLNRSMRESVGQGELALTLRLLDSMGALAQEYDALAPLPESTKSILQRLRGQMEAAQR